MEARTMGVWIHRGKGHLWKPGPQGSGSRAEPICSWRHHLSQRAISPFSSLLLPSSPHSVSHWPNPTKASQPEILRGQPPANSPGWRRGRRK